MSPPRRWVCLHFPQLGLDLARAAGHDDRRALVLIRDHPRPEVVAANAAARAAGIQPGMSPASAAALAPALERRRHDPTAEAAALERLAAWAYGVTSEVSCQAPQDLLLELGASRRLLGRDPIGVLAEPLAAFGYHASCGSGRHPAAAQLAARCALNTPKLVVHGMPCARYEDIRRAAPLRHSTLDPDTVATLAACGIHRLGELLALPRSGLLRRFGQPTLDLLDRLEGRLPYSLPRYRPPLRFHLALDWPAPIQECETLLFPLRRLFDELGAYLRGCDGAVQSLTIGFTLERAVRETSSPWSIRLDLLSPTRDTTHAFELARLRLQQTRLPAPVLGLSLGADRILPPSVRHGDLYATADRAVDDWPQVLDRLRARLGDEALRGLWLHPDPRPERAGRLGPWPPTVTPTGRTGAPDTRPLYLLAQPRPIERGAYRLLAGPERIESGWWDEGDVTRDYFRALDPNGACWWIFQDRRDPERWYAHGLFA
jgi:protein ImuB